MSDAQTAATIFETLAESAPDAIFTIDEHSVIRYANRATERVFGYRPEEVIGRRLVDLIPERYRAAHEVGIARYLRTGRRNIPWTGVQLPGLRKDGTEVPLEISFGEFTNEDGQHVFSGFMRDVSERARQRLEVERARAAAEATLRDMEAVGRIMDLALDSPTYSKMIEQLLYGLRREMDADESAVALLEEEQRELVVQQTGGVALNQRIRVPVGEGVIGKVAQTGQPVVIEDAANVGPGREAETIGMRSLVAVPIRSEGHLIGVLHVGARQPRRFAEKDVRLLETVGARVAAVMARTRLYQFTERRREQAEASVRSRDEVLSVVAHDLRNPVNTVLMSAALINDPDVSLSEGELRRQLQVIERSARRMNRMIQDLYDVARMEGGRFVVTCRCEDPGALAGEVFESFRPLAEEKALTMDCHVARPVPRVLADRDRIVQALENFLNNAIKFTPTGGTISLTVRSAAGGGVRFSVADTGPGIPLSELDNVFERFWQAKRTAHMGSGLGLAIVKGIAQAHRGTVGVESSPAGTTFWLELPHRRECA